MGVYLAKGTAIHGYRILDALPAGGEGQPYKAIAPDGRKVCLKQMNFAASDPSHKNSLKRFGRLRSLIGKRHPCVAETIDCFTTGDLAYVVTELVPGEPLDRVLASRKRLPPEEASAITQCVLEGLQYLHDLGVVHRDIKPGNIIYAEEGKIKAKLIDFGIALFGGTRITSKGFLGTLAFCPVEAFKGAEAAVDGRFDLYSLGVVLFEMLAGRPPFDTENQEELIGLIVKPERPLLSDFAPDIPPAFTQYVRRLMAYQPVERFPSAREALQGLEDALSGREPAVPPAVVPAAPKSFDVGSKARRELSVSEPSLRVVDGALAGTMIPIPENGIAIGRTMVNPEDKMVSRLHVRVSRQGRNLALADLGSSNGFIVQERRLRNVTLRHGDRVTLGRTTLEFLNQEGDKTK